LTFLGPRGFPFGHPRRFPGAQGADPLARDVSALRALFTDPPILAKAEASKWAGAGVSSFIGRV
jgi:hypothetical protein